MHNVVTDDVALVKGGGNPRNEVAFTHDRKRQNIGFTFFVLHQNYPMYDCYMKQLCTKTVKAGKVQFLKNWNKKGKRRIQNTGKGVVNKLHNITYKILKKNGSVHKPHLALVCSYKSSQQWCQLYLPEKAQAVVVQLCS